MTGEGRARLEHRLLVGQEWGSSLFSPLWSKVETRTRGGGDWRPGPPEDWMAGGATPQSLRWGGCPPKLLIGKDCAPASREGWGWSPNLTDLSRKKGCGVPKSTGQAGVGLRGRGGTKG